jgi:uncharacterized membrane protein YdjX (TVP38/TMEM64 family)
MNKIKKSLLFVVEKFKENRLKLFLAIIIIPLLIGGYELFFKHSTMFKNPEELKKWILSFGPFSVIMFVGIQIIQVVIFFIPGEVTQVAGGYIFGTFWGSILSSAGILMGSTIGYLFAKYFVKKHVIKMIEKKGLKRFKKVLDAGSSKSVILIIYLIPGIPKDVLVYVAGVSNVSLVDFIIYSSLGRFPWVLMSAYFGQGIHMENYTVMIIIAVVAVTLFGVGVWKGHEIIDFFHRLHQRKHKQ